MHQASEQYVGIWSNQLVAHTGIIQFPMKKGKKRIHRLVVLPDFQGIGIGTKFITEVAKIKASEGYEVNLTTTTPALVKALCKNTSWVLKRYGRATNWLTFKNLKYTHLSNTASSDRITYSFWVKR